MADNLTAEQRKKNMQNIKKQGYKNRTCVEKSIME